jgi:hypothetical protein
MMPLPRAVAITCAFLCMAICGCNYNPSPLHADLDHEDFRRIVRENFHVGMVAEEVERSLEGLNLQPEWIGRGSLNCFDSSARGFHVHIEPGGLYTRDFKGAPVGSHMHLVIDDADHLKCVSYDGSGTWSGGLIVQ